jgi:hypothetical protein
MEVQTPKSRWCPLLLGGSEHQRGNNMVGRRGQHGRKLKLKEAGDMRIVM